VLGDDNGIGKLNVKGCMELFFGVTRGAKEQQRCQKEHHKHQKNMLKDIGKDFFQITDNVK